MIRNLRKFFSLLRPYRVKVFLALIVGSIAGIATGGGIAKGAETLFGAVFNSEKELAVKQVMLIASLFPAIFLIIGLGTFGGAYLLNAAGLSAIRDLRAKLFAHLQNLPLGYFQSQKTGDLISRLTADSQMLHQTLTFMARNIIVQPATALSAFGYLTVTAIQQDGVAQIYVCIAILPIFIFPIRYFSRKLEKKARKQQEDLGLLTNDVAQNLTAVREIRSFNLQERETNRFAAHLSNLLLSQLKVVKYSFGLGPVIEIVASIGLAIAFVIGYQQGVSGVVFTAIFLALYFTYASVKRIGAFAGELYKGVAAMERIEQVIDEPIGVQDPDRPKEIEALEGTIEFSDVSFSYGQNTALANIDATIAKGSVCALVGPSGAGKTTFANLVPRFYDVASGSVSIDGLDTRDLRQADLRGQIAIVSQEPVLFDESILENIRLGREGASDEDVFEAAKQAFADEFISELPDGYSAIVGERGARLSGGQKQRIAIARAFLKNAPILILDEATSALDSESEKKVQQALEQLVTGKTTLIIAHRFSAIRAATQILVFDNGRIIDSGNHDTLYESCKLYRNLYDQQA